MNQTIRFIIAVILMVGVVIITNMIWPPAQRTTKVATDSLAPVQPHQPAANALPPVDTVKRGETIGVVTPPSAAVSTADTIIVESPLYRYAFSTRGAALISAEMLKFRSYTREGPVQLAGRTPTGLINHNIRVNGQVVDLASLPFTPSQHHVTLSEGSAARVLRFTHTSSSFGTISIDYGFRADNYLVDVRVTSSNAPTPVERLYLNLGPTLAHNEERAQDDERALAYVVHSRQQGIQSLPLRNLKEQRIEEGPLNWVALKNKYFVAAAIVDTAQTAQPFGGLIANDAPARYAANLTATLPPTAAGTFNYRLYLGPQEYDRLIGVGQQLQDVNPMGWKVFRPILRPLAEAITWALVKTQRALNIGYGWVLIIFGIGIRLLMWPLNAKAMRSQLKNMELQPRIKDIQTRYKNDPAKLQQEMMRLYKEEGMNPLGGCLPMLIPMPVLITLFFVFQQTIEFRGVSFLWLPDLSLHDPLYILPIVLGVTFFVQQYISMKSMPPNPQMQMMLWFMPAFMMLIFWKMASGLNLYYAAQNLPGFIQQVKMTKERQRYQKEKGLLTPAGTNAVASKKGAAAPQRKKR